MVKLSSSGYQLTKANNAQVQMAKWCVLIAVVVKTARSPARSYIRRGAMMSCMAIFGRDSRDMAFSWRGSSLNILPLQRRL